MNARALVLCALAAGCNPPPPGPSRVLSDDPMVAALPPSVTLLGGADLAALDRGALAAPFAERLGLLPSATPQLMGFGAGHAQRLVFGCGDHGCLALAEADLARADWCALAERSAERGAEASLRCSDPSEPGLDGALPSGDPLALRQLSPTKLVLGDRAAVRSAYPRASERGPALAPAAFDPSPLEGLIPEGALWVVAHRPGRLTRQATRRLEQHGSPRALALVETLDDALECCSDRLEDVEAVAAAVDAGDELTLTLRITCRDGLTARGVERALEDRLERALDEGSPPWVSALPRLELGRVGRTVELRGASGQGSLADLLASLEVSP